MAKDREGAKNAVHAEKEGWLSLQGSQGQARPVRAVLIDGTFKLYYTSSTKQVSGPLRQTSPGPPLAERQQHMDANGSTSSLQRSTFASPSTEQLHISGEELPSAKAVAHRILCDTEDETGYRALTLMANVSEVSAVLCTHVEQLLGRPMSSSPSAHALQALNQDIPHHIFAYCEAVLSYPALVLNTTVLSGIMRLVSALGSLDAQLAEQVKVKVSKAQEGAQRKLQQSLTPGPSGEASASQAPNSPPVSKSLWASRLLQCAEKGLPLSASLLLEAGFAEEFAEQVAAFHRRVWHNWSPVEDLSLLLHTPKTSASWRLNPLVFDANTPHFLGALAAKQVLNNDIDDHIRAKLLEKWVVIAARLRAYGDSVGWVAIVLVLFDPAILRLTATWSKVDRTLLARLAHGWGYEAFEVLKRSTIPFLDKKAFRTDTEDMGSRVAKADCIPYFGDAIINEPTDFHETARQLSRLEAIMEGWKAYYDSVEDEVPSIRTNEDPAHQCYLAVLAQQQVVASRADLLSLSLTIQPKFLGYYLPSFYQHVLPLTSGTMIPVLFTIVLPSFRLFPRSTLLLASQPKPPSKPRQVLRRSSSFPPAGPPQTTGILELDSGAREQLENTASAHVLGQVIRDLLNVGTDTIDTQAGIVFKAFPCDDYSNPRSSRTSSIIESLNTRRSHVGRQVVVKSASMVRLVDVLVLGAGLFGQDMVLDTEIHIATLLATYRSFCSPAEMLDMIQVRVRCARGAARTINNQIQKSGSFNPASQMWKTSEPQDTTDALAVRIITMIVAMLQIWVSDYFFDFLDDKYVLSAGRTLLKALRQEIETGSYPESVGTQCRRVTGAFARHRFSIDRHAEEEPSWLQYVYDVDWLSQQRNRKTSLPELPVTSLERDGGLGQINRIVDELDTLVADAFSRISMVDWMKLFEVLEQQTSTRLGLFSYSAPPHSSEADVVIQDVYSWLRTLQVPNSRSRVLDSLPKPIVSLVRLHCSLVSYFAAQVADPTLAHAHERRDRMSFMLKMLGVLRSRMRFFNLGTDFEDQEGQHIPSFLERAIASAILLPESRAYSSSWQAAGAEVARMFPQAYVPPTQGRSPNSAESVPNQRTIYIPSVPTRQGRPVTVCLGWVVERLLEIVCCVPNTSVEHPELINFDKRRYAYNLFKNMSAEFQGPEPTVTSDALLAKYHFLFGDACKNASIHLPLIDRKLHKEAVMREGKTKIRVFSDIVTQELEKLKSEARVHEKIDKLSTALNGPTGSQSFYGLPVSQSSTSLYSKRISRAVPSTSTVDVASILEGSSERTMDLSAPSSNGSTLSSSASNASTSPSKRSMSHGKRSRFGGFFRAVRPLSVLGVSGGGSTGGLNNPTSPTGQSQGLFYAHPGGSSHSLQKFSDDNGSEAPWIPDENIDLANRPAICDYAADDWQPISEYDIDSLCSVKLRSPTVLAIMHRVGPKAETLLLRAPTCEDAVEWRDITSKLMVQKMHESTRVFGVPLEIVCHREQQKVPAFLETLLAQIEERGLDEVGIYRISGSLAAVNGIKQWFDQGNTSCKQNDPRWSDINAIAGCIKLYLRELPQPLMTDELFPDFMQVIGPRGVDVDQLRQAIRKLPGPNYDVLDRICRHLKLVVDHSSQNKMNVQNIAIVFSVNFLPPVAMSQMGGMQQLVSKLVLLHDEIFT